MSAFWGRIAALLSALLKAVEARERGTFPAYALRGIRKSDHVQSDGTRMTISGMAFWPEHPKPARDDAAGETSINWEDDEDAVPYTLASTHIAKYGAARVDLLKEIASMPAQHLKCVGCERRKSTHAPDNKYHGNILFFELPRYLERALAARFASAAEFIPPAPEA